MRSLPRTRIRLITGPVLVEAAVTDWVGAAPGAAGAVVGAGAGAERCSRVCSSVGSAGGGVAWPAGGVAGAGVCAHAGVNAVDPRSNARPEAKASARGRDLIIDQPSQGWAAQEKRPPRNWNTRS